MPFITQESNLGDLLKYEAPNLYSRDPVTVAAGQDLPPGTVIGLESATGKAKALDPAASDGTQIAAGVLAFAVNATLIERDDGVLVARHAVVADHAIAWPASVNPVQKDVAIAQLKALGVLVRHAV